VPRVVLAYLLCALIWGTTWFAIRVCIGPGGYPTLSALALRFAIAAVLLLPLALRARGWPQDARTWSWLIAAGILDAVGYGLVYIGEERVSGGIAAVVYGTQPLLLAILLTVVRIERLTTRHVAGAIISLAGVALLFLDRLDVSPDQAFGVALVFGSVVVATCYNVIVKRHGEGVNPVVTTTVFIVVTAIVLGAVALAIHRPIPWPLPVKPTIALGYLAVMGTVVAFLCYFWLLRRTSLLVTSTQVFVFPLVALLTDALFERAISLGPRAYLGAGITLAGLAVSLRRPVQAGRIGVDVDDRA
jgi:drug/metabolite transporter (DMT)-like permease